MCTACAYTQGTEISGIQLGKCRKIAQLYTKLFKKAKPSLKAKADRSLIGALISLRTATAIFSHGGERLTMAPCGGGE